MAGFLAIALLARASHPARTSPSSSGSASAATVVQSEDDQGFSLQPGQLGQSSGSQGGGAQTGVS